jgi:hypothetical protein
MPENTQGSTAVPEATAVATVVPDEGVVEQLVSMGFSTNGWGLPQGDGPLRTPTAVQSVLTCVRVPRYSRLTP